MGFPDKLMADDERLVDHLHPHWLTLVPATLWFLVVCAAAGTTIAVLPTSEPAHKILLPAVIVVALVLVSWLAVGPWVRWRTTHYVFTTHRVLIRRGVLRHTGRDISLQRINDVAFSQSLFDRIVGAGTLVIESAGEHGQETLSYLPRSDRVQQTLNRLIEQDGERRARGSWDGPAAQNFPSQGFPAQGFPAQGLPAQGLPTQGLPAQGLPTQGLPTQGYPPYR